ncbi:hypothetical protein MTO96_040917 [Rhipicephalus appendiculatus]
MEETGGSGSSRLSTWADMWAEARWLGLWGCGPVARHARIDARPENIWRGPSFRSGARSALPPCREYSASLHCLNETDVFVNPVEVPSVPHCSHCWPATFSEEIPWDTDRTNPLASAMAIPIPQSERGNAIETIRTSGAAAGPQQGSSDKNKHDPGPTPPTNDASAIKEPQQGPASPHLDCQNSTHQEMKLRKRLRENMKCDML